MTTSAKPSSNYGWLLLLMALAYGAVMLHLSGSFLHHANGVVRYPLLQAQALLSGHFSLGNSLSQLHPGLVWHNGQIQQVWGLGVAFWLLPFQALWRLMGGNWFPDRLALGLAFVLLALYAGYTGLRWVRQGKTLFGIGFIWLILLSPPLWTLSRASQLVFEETVLYGLLLSLGILVALVRSLCFHLHRDFWLCCLLGGLSGLVRPTLAVYGVGGVFVCGLIEYLRHRPLKPLLPGVGLLLAGLVTLAVTNQQRFGSPFEFGHRLTVSSESMVYLTRFGNPYQQAGNMAAAKELSGLLFLSPPIHDNPAFAEELFPGQAPDIRWRRLNLTAFDPGFLAITVFAFALFLWWLYCCLRKKPGQLDGGLFMGLSLWSGTSFVALFIFYLHYPTITSRYLLDFLPALVGLALLVWWQVSAWWPRLGILALAGWLIHGIASGQVIASTGQPFPGLKPASTLSLNSFAGAYTPPHYPAQTGIMLNGSGWDMESGIANDVVILAMDQPQFVELQVSKRRTMDGSPAQADVYQAILDGQPLHIRKIEPEIDGFKVRFDIPDAIRQQKTDQILFLCFSQGYDQADRESERFLYSVRWK